MALCFARSALVIDNMDGREFRGLEGMVRGCSMDGPMDIGGREGMYGMNDKGGPEPEAIEEAVTIAELYELLEKGGSLSGTVGQSDWSMASLSSRCSRAANSLGVGRGMGKRTSLETKLGSKATMLDSIQRATSEASAALWRECGGCMSHPPLYEQCFEHAPF